MNTRTAPHGFNFDILRAALRPVPRVRVAAPAVARADWIERLAAWAERQPVHHRMGSWERLR